MSQKQKFHHNNNTPTPPAEGWAAAYANLDNPLFNSLVADLNEGHILPTETAVKVYNKNPYLWPINPYRFTRFFERAITCMSTDEESTFFSSLPSSPLALQINLSKESTVPGTILGSNHNREQSPKSEHKFSQSQPSNPASAFLASRKSLPPKRMSTQFSESGRPVAGTPMASMSSYHESHQQMHLSGVLVPLTNGRYQFKIVPLLGITSKNTYMYPSQNDHRLWFIFYRLDKRADPAEAARKLTKGGHHIMSNGKVIYPRFKIGKNSELVAATRNHIMELHGPNPKGVTTSCFYMIVEFEEPMSPNLVVFDAGEGKVLPKMYDIIKEEASLDDDTGELVFNLQTEARYHAILNNSEDDTEEDDDAGNR